MDLTILLCISINCRFSSWNPAIACKTYSAVTIYTYNYVCTYIHKIWVTRTTPLTMDDPVYYVV